MAGSEGQGGPEHGVRGGGQTLGVWEEGPLEVGEQPLGENQAKGRPERERGVQEAGWSWGDGGAAPGEGVPGGEGPTCRWVR